MGRGIGVDRTPTGGHKSDEIGTKVTQRPGDRGEQLGTKPSPVMHTRPDGQHRAEGRKVGDNGMKSTSSGPARVGQENGSAANMKVPASRKNSDYPSF